MDAPPIQYAKTSDGVSIAYYAIGEGPAGILMNAIPFRHILRQWEILPEDKQIAALVQERGRRIVQFDPRGMGSSSRVESFDLDGFVADLEAVADQLTLDEFDLVAATYSTPIAIAYAARHPERVSHLALTTPFTEGAKALDSATGRALRAIRGQDWSVYPDAAMHLVFGWENTERSRQLAAVMRDAIRPEDAKNIFDAVEAFDVTDVLEQVRAPTLVVYPSQGTFIPAEHSRAVAAGIPGAAFVTAPAEQTLLVVGRFLGLIDEVLAPTEVVGSGTAIILFADIADSTALTERMGDAAFREKARGLDEALRRAITSNGGTAIEGKLLGDGVLATFGAAREAIACAAACHEAGSSAGLSLHVGIHAGDVIREANNVYGGAVNIASRVAGEAAAGETLVSATVRDLARTSAGVEFEDRGERELKGVSEPVRVYAVREN